jgi:hypothetical protein
MRKGSKYERLECSDKQFNVDKDIQTDNGTFFMEHIKGARKRLIVHNQVVSATISKNHIDLGKLTKLRFTALLGRFNKQLYRRFRTIPELYDIDIVFNGNSKGKNKDVWESMKNGQVFYNPDIRTAYWQVGNKLGYIDHSLFVDLLHDDVTKQAKRYCFSFLKRDNYMNYHTDKGNYTITCDTTVLKKVTNNVRAQLYNDIAYAKDGLKKVIEWNTDGICVLPEELDIVTARLKECGLEYKISYCVKIDEYTYKCGSKIKNFALRK